MVCFHHGSKLMSKTQCLSTSSKVCQKLKTTILFYALGANDRYKGQMDQKAKVEQLMVNLRYGSKVRFKGRVINAFFHR